jgi:hypothetical protein
MTEAEKTHYRKAFDSPYLSSADIVDPIVVTVKHVRLESDRTKKTKDEFNTAHFVEREIRQGERLKPMILNATNSKMLAQITGSKWIDDWRDVAIMIYVDPHVRFGKETVEGLRVGRAADRPSAAPDALISAAEAEADKGTEAYAAHWKALDNKGRKALFPHHDALKERAAKVGT